MDFAVFPYIKSFLRGQRFDDLPELRQEVMNIILNMKTEQFEKIFDDWLKRCEKCVELNELTVWPRGTVCVSSIPFLSIKRINIFFPSDLVIFAFFGGGELQFFH
jgi:hypothetical protein